MLGPDEFRRTLGHFATGVTVVTTWDADGQPTGLTASSIASVSLHPPLVLVCVSHNSQTYPALQAGQKFAVSVLATGQEALARRFASSTLTGAQKFEGVGYRPGLFGQPVLADALAEFECTIVHTYPGGDHTIFVGQVEAADCRGDAGREPLLYYRGKYGRLHLPDGAG